MICFENGACQETKFQEIVFKEEHACNNFLYNLDDTKLNFYNLSQEFGYITSFDLFYHIKCNKGLHFIVEKENDLLIENIFNLSEGLNLSYQTKMNSIEARFLQNINFITSNRILCYKCKKRSLQRRHYHSCTDDIPRNQARVKLNLPQCLQDKIISLSQNAVIQCGELFSDVFEFINNCDFIDSCLHCKCQKNKYCNCFSKHMNLIRRRKFNVHKNHHRSDNIQFFKNNHSQTNFIIATFFDHCNKSHTFYYKELRNLKNFKLYWFFKDIVKRNEFIYLRGNSIPFRRYKIVDTKIVSLIPQFKPDPVSTRCDIAEPNTSKSDSAATYVDWPDIFSPDC